MAGGYSPVTGSITQTSSGATAGIPLEPTARTTTLMLQSSGITSTSTQAIATTRIEITLDTWIPGGVTQHWCNASSIVYQLASSANNLLLDGIMLTISGPIAGARLNSTSWAPAAGTLTLKTLQSITAGP